ncbi:hypothetical protein [Allonocardiopsis opalescens]|uniref:Uncharacterized protein n=1 Tax=Allonocardiopsis opalescens TaxID=1144618 RepID=A0A2T0PVQ6_9ACTN|nr:hypothetical protein [Allonocardiopsis opalescens]PRX95612.1 hypothetical protein CLV72_109221 [Allonocardiopsis opalescens]
MGAAADRYGDAVPAHLARLSPELRDHVVATVDAAPPLTPEQRARLAVLLRPAATAPRRPSAA